MTSLRQHFAHGISATKNTFDGLQQTFKNEIAFRQEVFALIGIIFIAPLTISYTQTLVLVFMWLFVMALELINSGIESLADAITLDRHPLIKRAKDAGSAAVGLAILSVVLMWAFFIIDSFIDY